MCVSHGGPDDVGAMDAILMSKLLGLVEPLSSQVPQLAPVTNSRLQLPECRHVSHFSTSQNLLAQENILV